MAHEDVGDTGGLDLSVAAETSRGWKMNKITTTGVLAVIAVLGVLGVGGGMLYYTIPPASEKYFLIFLTFLVTKIGTVFDYYFGSSQGSADKTDIIGNLTAPPAGTTTVVTTDTVKVP